MATIDKVNVYAAVQTPVLAGQPKGAVDEQRPDSVGCTLAVLAGPFTRQPWPGSEPD